MTWDRPAPYRLDTCFAPFVRKQGATAGPLPFFMIRRALLRCPMSQRLRPFGCGGFLLGIFSAPLKGTSHG